MSINTDRLLRAVFFVCMELDSERPTVREMLARLRQLGQPMRQETVRVWLKNEHLKRDEKKNSLSQGNPCNDKAGHKADTKRTQGGTHEKPDKTRVPRANGTQDGTQSGHLRARDKTVLSERELEYSVLYSQNVVREAVENSTTTTQITCEAPPAPAPIQDAANELADEWAERERRGDNIPPEKRRENIERLRNLGLALPMPPEMGRKPARNTAGGLGPIKPPGGAL